MDYYDIKKIIDTTKSQTIVERKKFNNIIDAVLDVIDNENMARSFTRSNKPSSRQTVKMIDMVAKRMGYKSGSDIDLDMEDEIRDTLLNVINNNKKEMLMKDNLDIKSVVEAYASIVNEESHLYEEAFKATNAESQIKDAVEYLNKELKKIFDPSDGWKSFAKGQETAIVVRIMNTESARNNIPQNSKSFSQFIIHLSDNSGNIVDLDKVSWERLQGPRSIKYRKISSNRSLGDANKKLIQYFEKNRSAYYNIEDLN